MDHIRLCGELIAQKMSAIDISAWSNAYYHSLGAKIWKESRVRLSVNTLKRVFGKIKTEQYYVPQKATLNALAIFLGYENWEVFKTANQLPGYIELNGEKKLAADVSKGKKDFGPFSQTISYFMYVALAIVVIAAVSSYLNNGSAYKEVRMSCKNPKGSNSHSAAFKLICPPSFRDTTSFVLDFDDGEQEKMSCMQQEVNHYYQTPGWYMVHLKYKNEVVDSTVVVVQSDGWFAYVNKNRPLAERYRLHKFDGRIESLNSLTNSDINKAGIDTVQQFFVNFVNIKDTDISGDGFELVADVRSSDYLKRGHCASINFNIFGNLGAHCAGVANPECTTQANATFSEQVKTGIRNDLRAFGYNLVNGGIFKLNIKNKVVRVFLDNKLIYTVAYQKSIGKIKGVEVRFSGLGEIRSFSLKDLRTGAAF